MMTTSECYKTLGAMFYKQGNQSSKQRFCFEVDGCVFRLNMDRQTSDLAILSFVDEESQAMQFPAGLTVADVSGQPALYLDGKYVLMWANSYEIHYNGVCMVAISSQRQQIIFGAVNAYKDYHHKREVTNN